MNREREIQVLKYKIVDLEKKISNFEKFKISDVKTENLRILKLKYEDQLTELEFQ